MVNAWRDPGMVLQFSDCDEIPKDATVVAVETNFSTRSVDMILYHESFPIVPEGVECPFIEGMSEFKTITVEDLLRYRGYKISEV